MLDDKCGNLCSVRYFEFSFIIITETYGKIIVILEFLQLKIKQQNSAFKNLFLKTSLCVET